MMMVMVARNTALAAVFNIVLAMPPAIPRSVLLWAYPAAHTPDACRFVSAGDYVATGKVQVRWAK